MARSFAQKAGLRTCWGYRFVLAILMSCVYVEAGTEDINWRNIGEVPEWTVTIDACGAANVPAIYDTICEYFGVHDRLHASIKQRDPNRILVSIRESERDRIQAKLDRVLGALDEKIEVSWHRPGPPGTAPTSCEPAVPSDPSPSSSEVAESETKKPQSPSMLILTTWHEASGALNRLHARLVAAQCLIRTPVPKNLVADIFQLSGEWAAKSRNRPAQTTGADELIARTQCALDLASAIGLGTPSVQEALNSFKEGASNAGVIASRLTKLGHTALQRNDFTRMLERYSEILQTTGRVRLLMAGLGSKLHGDTQPPKRRGTSETIPTQSTSPATSPVWIDVAFVILSTDNANHEATLASKSECIPELKVARFRAERPSD